MNCCLLDFLMNIVFRTRCCFFCALCTIVRFIHQGWQKRSVGMITSSQRPNNTTYTLELDVYMVLKQLGIYQWQDFHYLPTRQTFHIHEQVDWSHLVKVFSFFWYRRVTLWLNLVIVIITTDDLSIYTMATLNRRSLIHMFEERFRAICSAVQHTSTSIFNHFRKLMTARHLNRTPMKLMYFHYVITASEQS